MKKEYRIKKNTEIESVIRNKKSFAGKCFIMYINENHEQKHFRLGISVSKKYGDAVQRNKLKRQLRACFMNINIKPVDIFVVTKKAVNDPSFEEIQNDILNLMKRHKIVEENNEKEE